MKPYIHCQISVAKFGGKEEDYQKIHNWFDQTKAHVPDLRHRTILHNSFGIFLLEQVFGTNIKNSDGKLISVRDLGEQHVLDDLGFIPTLQDCLLKMPLYDWLYGKKSESHALTNKDVTKEKLPRNNSTMVMDGSRQVLDRIEKERDEEFRKTFPMTAAAISGPLKLGGDGTLSQEEIDALLMGMDEADQKAEKDEHLSQDEIDQMLFAIARPNWDDAVQMYFEFVNDDVIPIKCPDEIVLENEPMSNLEEKWHDMQTMQKQNNTSFYHSGSKHLDQAVAMAYRLYKQFKSLGLVTSIKMATRQTCYHWRFRHYSFKQIENHLRKCIALKEAK